MSIKIMSMGKSIRSNSPSGVGISKKYPKENVFRIGEFGIGMNYKSRLIGNPLEDEKVFKTIHFGIGDNSTFGGDNIAGIHLDGVIKKPSLSISGIDIFLNDTYLINSKYGR